MALASTNIENDPQTAASGSPAAGAGRTSPLAAVQGQAGQKPRNPLTETLTSQIQGLEKVRSEKRKVIDDAIANLSTRQAETGPSAEELFRLMGAFAAPTKTGSFFENLGQVGNTAADILGKRRESKANLQDLMTKYKLAGADLDAEHLKDVISGHRELQSASAPTSAYGRQAMDEGLQPGTPEFVARIRELSQFDEEVKRQKAEGGVKPDAFDKQGNFRTASGTVISKAEVSKDRETRTKLIDQKAKFAKITDKTINNALSQFDVTGAGITGQFGKGLAGLVGKDLLDSQTKIYTQAIDGIQAALPPGPASDKDVAQAKATFPGFSNKKALKEWLKGLEAMVDRHITEQDSKYGNEKWWGEGGAPKASSVNPNAAGANAAPPPAPKKGAVLNGYTFNGGDPRDEKNWTKS